MLFLFVEKILSMHNEGSSESVSEIAKYLGEKNLGGKVHSKNKVL